jgi:hypothetical protein
MSKNSLKSLIYNVLESQPRSRDDDLYLTLCIWNRFYDHKIFKNEEGLVCVRLTDILELPREDHIKRLRAQIQNVEGKYLPTNLSVCKKRKISEQKWRDYLSTEHLRK